MKRRRVLFGLLAIISLIALVSTGDAIYLWIIFFQGCILLAGWLQVKVTFRGIDISLELPEGRAESGGTIKLPLTVSTQMPIPPAHLAVELVTADARKARTVVFASVTPGKGGETVLECECPYRGEFEIGASAIEGIDAFGLVRLRIEGDRLKANRSTVVVLPRSYDVFAGRSDLRVSEGAEEGAKRDAGEVSSIAELRSWREGDELRRVHWKLSARLGELTVKEFAGSYDARSLVFVDGVRAEDEGGSGADPVSTAAKGAPASGAPAAADADAEDVGAPPDSRAEGAAQPPRAAADAAELTEHEKLIARLDGEETLAAAAASLCAALGEAGQQVRLVGCGENRVEVEGGVGEENRLALARLRFGAGVPAARVLSLDIERRGAPDSLVYVSRAQTPEMIELLCSLGARGSRVLLVCCGEELTPAARAELGAHSVAILRARAVKGGVLI